MASKICKNCIYYLDGGFANYSYCRRLTEKRLFGDDDYKRVKPGDSCDLFLEADTAENSNFKSSGGSSCFLTSACVEYLGKSDDCEELTKLRTFRDTYMNSSESGKKLVKEYYEVAPQIVERINTSEDVNYYYKKIYAVIEKCVSLIDEGKNEETLKEYKTMVIELKSNLLNY